ncbi:MAG: nitroreductase family deazaflavin-dependent oxidoreductase [Acidimicrobiia bacterium]
MATKVVTRTHIALYRSTGGKLGGRFRGSPALLLTTTGRRSGKPRTNPLLYIDDGSRKIVVASSGGADKHPAWYQNLVAHPEVTVQAGPAVQRMRAEVADPEERARLWPPLVAMYPTYDDYQAKTERQLPVVVLTPASRGSGGQPE